MLAPVPQRPWLLAVALGLVLASSGQAQEEAPGTQGETPEQEQPAQALPLPFPVEVIEDDAAAEARDAREEEARQREIADLAAQVGMNSAAQAMNDATQRMAEYAFWSAWLVFSGTCLLGVTLYFTRQANKAAQSAVAVTRETGRDQARAYVHVDTAEFYWTRRPSDPACIVLIVQNTGQTPAKWFEVSCRTRPFELKDDGSAAAPMVFDETELEGITPRRWPALGSSSSLTCVTPPFSDVDNPRGTFRDSYLGLRTVGTVRYETFFGEIFESQFDFFGRSFPTDKGQVKLARSTTHLETYKKVSG